MRSECIKLVLVSFTLSAACALVLSSYIKCLRGVHVLREALVDTIPLPRANRLAAMRDSDDRITSIFTPFLRGPLRFTYALVL